MRSRRESSSSCFSRGVWAGAGEEEEAADGGAYRAHGRGEVEGHAKEAEAPQRARNNKQITTTNFDAIPELMGAVTEQLFRRAALRLKEEADVPYKTAATPRSRRCYRCCPVFLASHFLGAVTVYLRLHAARRTRQPPSGPCPS